jgi:hypothetical protein
MSYLNDKLHAIFFGVLAHHTARQMLQGSAEQNNRKRKSQKKTEEGRRKTDA